MKTLRTEAARQHGLDTDPAAVSFKGDDNLDYTVSVSTRVVQP